MSWPAGSPCDATETLMKILSYAQLRAPSPERERIIELVAACMDHPPEGIDSNGMPYTVQDHCDSVNEAWDSIRDGHDDWDACIEEMEHLGSPGDVESSEGEPKPDFADKFYARHFARRIVQFGWRAERVRELIEKFLPEIQKREDARIERRKRRRGKSGPDDE